MRKDLEQFLKSKLEIPVNAHGVELKTLQNELVNMLGSVNEIRDSLNYTVAARKARIADLEAIAVLECKESDDIKASKSIIMSKVLNASVRHYEIFVKYQSALDSAAAGIILVDGEPSEVGTSVSIEEHLLLRDLYRYNTAKSKTEELIHMLWVCRSGLSFDKQEMQHI